MSYNNLDFATISQKLLIWEAALENLFEALEWADTLHIANRYIDTLIAYMAMKKWTPDVKGKFIVIWGTQMNELVHEVNEALNG